MTNTPRERIKSPPITCVFLDRDGVINQDSPGYIKSWQEFHFLPGSLQALRLLARAGLKVILITNQSVIGRGMTSAAELENIHLRMRAAVEAAGGLIHDIFFCPHHPEDRCVCRKPAPGLIHAARQAHGLDLAAACMVGDSARDMECAQNAGVPLKILVRTGNGLAAGPDLAARGIQPDHVAENLLDAARWIRRHARRPSFSPCA